MTDAGRLDDFIDRFTPEVAAAGRAALAAMRDLLPGAVQLVYDNYNALAIAFGASEKLKDILFSIAFYPRWVSLFVTGGEAMADPDGLFEGAGGTMRHIKLRSGLTIDDPRVVRLVRERQAMGPLWDAARPGRIVIKSVAAKQRPRRP